MFLIFLGRIGFSQITLIPATTTFSLESIILDEVAKGEYLSVSGDLKYLNIKFIARWSDNNPSRKIGVTCYLNCWNPDKDIRSFCKGYQNATVEVYPGEGYVTIPNPKYNLTGENIVYCLFFVPEYSDVQYFPYPNKTFVASGLRIDIPPSLKIDAGETLLLQIKVTNVGIFEENFVVNVTPESRLSPLIVIEDPYLTTRVLKPNDWEDIYSRVVFLESGSRNIFVRGRSNTTVSCSLDSDCSFLEKGKCIDNVCFYEEVVSIEAKMLSMPEYGLEGVIEIILFASLIFLLKKGS